jgi:cell division protein FtsQ
VSEPRLPSPDHVPDNVLQELHGAFSDPTPNYDFDDPALDHLLGLGRHADETPAPDDTGAMDDLPLSGEVRVTRRESAPAPSTAPAPVSHLETAEVPVVASEPPARRTIVIAGDELPDPVYIDEEKEREFYERREAVGHDVNRSTIVIDDLDEGRVIEVAEARVSSGIDPRIRARRTAVRKAEGRKRLMWVGIAFGAFALVVCIIAVFASSLFDVRNVEVQGVVYSDQAAIDEVVASLEGKAVLLVDTHAAEVKLEAIPWVERATVETDFPHTVYIDIRERRAAAAFQGADGQFRVIDITGRVLAVSTGQPADLMLIDGTNPNTAAGAWTPTSYRDAAQMVVALPTEIRQVTSYAGVDPATGGLSLTLNGTVKVRLGNAENLEEKLARLLARVRIGLNGVCELDVATAEVGAVACPVE